MQINVPDDIAVRVALMQARKQRKLADLAAEVGLSNDRLLAIMAGAAPSKDETKVILERVR